MDLIVKDRVEFSEFTQQNLAEVADIFDVNDNIKGVKGRMPKISIIHQAKQFTNSLGDTFKAFKGIILHHTPCNVYWEKDFTETGGGTLPDCASSNAILPDSGENLQAENCMKCENNKFKSASDGRGKACKNIWRLHILQEGQSIPIRLTLSPANIGVIQDFLVNLRSMNIPHELCIAEFGLVGTKNKDGIEYSQITIKPVSFIKDRETALNLKKVKDEFSVAFGEEILIDEVE